MTLSEKLGSLHPYLIGIRYIEGIPVVDIVLKDDWTTLENNKIIAKKGDEGLNYYMFFNNDESLNLDDILTHVELTINFNIEREKKHELLVQKINELKEIFKKTPLSNLKKLRFQFQSSEDILTPSLSEFTPDQTTYEPIVENNEIDDNTQSLTTDNTPQMELSEEDKEILEEEARGERNRKLIESNKSKSSVKNIHKKIELPPKKNIDNLNNYCSCEPNEACDICIDDKY